MGSSKKHKEKDREHKHKKRKRSRSKERKSRRDEDKKHRRDEDYHGHDEGQLDQKYRRMEDNGQNRQDFSSSHDIPKSSVVLKTELQASDPTNALESMSIEQTNKLRAKLGLRPLDVDSRNMGSNRVKDEGNEVAPLLIKGDDGISAYHAPPVNISEVKKTSALKEKLEAIKEKRRINLALGKVKTLGDSDSDNDDIKKWVKKSRKNEKEKKMADKRAKVLEEMDEEFGIGGLLNEEFKVDKGKKYTSADLGGLQVQHGQDSFVEGKSVILTLQDKGILDEDQDDVLVNVNIIDNEKAKKNIDNKKKRPGYVAYDEPEYDDFGQPKVKKLLSKYDEEIEGEKRDNFKLGSHGRYSSEKDREMAQIRHNLKNQAQTLSLPAPNLASEYLSQEDIENGKFKKVTKKVRKIRKKPSVVKADDLLPLDGDVNGMHHGSRAHGRRHHHDEGEVVDYNHGIVDMEIDEQPLNPDEPEIEGPDQDLTNVAIEEDEAQLELQLALNKARKLKKRNEEPKPEKVAEHIHLSRELSTESDVNLSSASIMLNATSEFCRSLGEIPTYGLAGNRDEERDEVLDIELEAMQERRRIEMEEEDQKSGWLRVEVENKPVNITDGEEMPVLDEEPSLTEGVAGALLLAQKKGYIEGESKKGTGHKLSAKIQAQYYSIEDKKYDDIDEKYRHKQNRYGGGMLMDFKEKDSYRPDVKLEYVDDKGRFLNAKEAFKQLSYRFHGKGSGKRKTEKLMKKREEEQLMKNMSSTDTPLGTTALLQEKQRQEKTPYLVLSGGGVKTMTGGSTLTK